jgi:CMP/dCMP kinase
VSGSSVPVIVAIDGPAGAGKSTVSRSLAQRLGLGHLDTGAMYRAVTAAVLRAGIDPDDERAVADLCTNLRIVLESGTVLVDGVDVTEEIRGPLVTAAVSAVAANSAVRADLVARQRSWAVERGGGVLEGRDIGSVVFPDAVLKVYLTASARTRAQRRVAEAGGDVEAIERSIMERDQRDAGRVDSPLRATSDAVVVDSTQRSVDSIVDDLEALVTTALGARATTDGGLSR